MLIIIQFPIFDLRRFFDSDFLPLVSWLSIIDNDINKKFIRSVGPLKRRRLGANSCGDEAIFAKSKNAIRFKTLPSITYKKKSQYVSKFVKPKFRRFYSDGDICSKYEVGFSIDIDDADSIEHNNFIKFLDELANCKVVVPIPFIKTNEIPLISAGKSLSKQYLFASTSRKTIASKKISGVYFGSPCIYIDKKENESLSLNLFKKDIQLKKYFTSLSLCRLTISKIETKLWISESQNNIFSREVRIAILKQNVFREALQVVLKEIEQNKLLPVERSTESDELQEFLRKCFSNYFKEFSSKIDESEIYDLVIQIEDEFGIVNRKKLEENLKSKINIRGNYFNSILKYLDKMEESKKENKIRKTEIYAQNVIYSEKDVNQSDINQSFVNSQNQIDNANMSKELAELLIKLTEDTQSIIKFLSPDKQRIISENLDGMTKEISQAKKEPSKFMKFYTPFVETLKSIGEVAIPILNIAEKVLTLI